LINEAAIARASAGLFFMPTSLVIRLITNTVFVKSVIYDRKETRFVEGKKGKFDVGLNCTTLESRLTHNNFTATTSAQHANYKPGEKNCSKEGCETEGQENVGLNKAYDHHGQEQGDKPVPWTQCEDFLAWVTKE
jgi:hypothetical protein